MVKLADVPEPERSAIRGFACPVFHHTPFADAPPPGRRHAALVSSAGFVLRGERPLLGRDTGYRAIPSAAGDGDVLCSHVSTNFDRTGFQQDLEVMLPRRGLQALAAGGVIGVAADTHYSFMGATEPEKLEGKARELGRKLVAGGVNCVVLAPV